MSDAQEIAVSLSDAQRAWLMSLHGVLSNAFYPGRHHMACRALAEAGLLTPTEDVFGHAMFRLTRRGRAVREELARQRDEL